MTDNTYNGWSNRDTWLVNLWYGDYLSDCGTVSANFIEELVEEGKPEIETGLWSDAMSSFNPDYRELAEHYGDWDWLETKVDEDKND